MKYKYNRLQILNFSALLILFAALITTVASVPTSVLVQNTELASNTNANNRSHGSFNSITKVKRSSNEARESSASNNAALFEKKSSPEVLPASFNSPSSQTSSRATVAGARPLSAGILSLPTHREITIPLNSAVAAGLTAAAIEASTADANQREYDLQQPLPQLYKDYEARTQILNKRGINSQQLLYEGSYGDIYGNDDYYNNPYSASAPIGPPAAGGIWSDELDPSVVYPDLQDLDEYTTGPRVSPYRNKAYDSLQSLLNSEAYLEPIVYPSRYYGAINDNKRSNMNNYNKYNDRRLKRDNRLTSADLLALVALVEAGERAKEGDSDDAGYSYVSDDSYNTKYYPNDQYEVLNEPEDYNRAMIDYYGVPLNMETIPKYQKMPREHRYDNLNPLGAKRFMVAKKKRSLGKFSNEPEPKANIYYNTNGAKYF